MENDTKVDNNLGSQTNNVAINTSEQSKLKKLIFALFYLLLISFIVIGGLFIYQKQKIKTSTTSGGSSAISNLLKGHVKYTSTENDYEFYHPKEWKVISEVPDNFMYVEMFNNLVGQEGVDWFNTEAGLNTWLNGKMFTKKTCRGPILQNTNDPDLLIVFDIDKTNSDEPACFGAGYFFDTIKWKVADQIPYPINEENTDNIRKVEWKGDFRIVNKITTNTDFKVIVALINRETYTLKGESDFSQILSTFKFIK